MESGPPQNGVRGPYFLLTFLLISPHPLICERGDLYHLNKNKKLLHICQHVELVNYPFNEKCAMPRQATITFHCRDITPQVVTTSTE